MEKLKRKNEQQQRKSHRLLLLLPIGAFLVLTLPSFLVVELVNYLFADKLVYPLAFLTIMTGLHVIIGICLLIGWVTIRLIVFRKFIRELLASIVLLVLALLYIRLDVILFETVDKFNIEGKHYYLRQAVIHDYSTKMWDEPNGNYVFVHKCDSISLQCETIFIERRVPLPGFEVHLEFYRDNDQLLLAYFTPNTREVETVVAIIEDNLDEPIQ